jgi:hypothetical protein
MVNSATNLSRRSSAKEWSGLSGPPLSPSLMPRMNTVLYCSIAGCPVSSVLTTRLVKRVPERPARMA